MHYKDFLVEDKNNANYESEFFKIKYIFELNANENSFEDFDIEFHGGIRHSIVKYFSLYEGKNTNLTFDELEQKIYAKMGINEQMMCVSSFMDDIFLGINKEKLLFYIEFIYSITKFLEELIKNKKIESINNKEFLASQINYLYKHIELVLSNLNCEIIKDSGEYSVVSSGDKLLVDTAIDLNSREILYKYIEVNNMNNVINKRNILKIVANNYEKISGEVSNLDMKLHDKISFIFNNCEIRHNNVDETYKKGRLSNTFHKVVKDLSDEEFIKIYDYLFYMYLYSNALIKNKDSVEIVPKLRNSLDSKVN